MEGTFSISISLRDVPRVEMSMERDCCWLTLLTFNRDDCGLSSLTVHLPGRGPDAAIVARQLAEALIGTAERIEATHEPEPVSALEMGDAD